MSDESDFSSVASSPTAAHAAPQRFNFGRARPTAVAAASASSPNTNTTTGGTPTTTNASKPVVVKTLLQTTVQPAGGRRLQRKFSLRGMEEDGFDTDSTFGSTPGVTPVARSGMGFRLSLIHI